jgi:ActR/RegA family two-component response regulator
LSAPRLLLFDDDAAIVAVVKRYFDGRSWQVDTATDAERDCASWTRAGRSTR